MGFWMFLRADHMVFFQPVFLQLSCHSHRNKWLYAYLATVEGYPRSWCVLRSGNPFPKITLILDSVVFFPEISWNLPRFCLETTSQRWGPIEFIRTACFLAIWNGTKAAIIGSLGNKDPTKTLGKHHCEQSKAKKSILASSYIAHWKGIGTFCFLWIEILELF